MKPTDNAPGTRRRTKTSYAEIVSIERIGSDVAIYAVVDEKAADFADQFVEQKAIRSLSDVTCNALNDYLESPRKFLNKKRRGGGGTRRTRKANPPASSIPTSAPSTSVGGSQALLDSPPSDRFTAPANTMATHGDRTDDNRIGERELPEPSRVSGPRPGSYGTAPAMVSTPPHVTRTPDDTVPSGLSRQASAVEPTVHRRTNQLSDLPQTHGQARHQTSPTAKSATPQIELPDSLGPLLDAAQRQQYTEPQRAHPERESDPPDPVPREPRHW